MAENQQKYPIVETNKQISNIQRLMIFKYRIEKEHIL